LKPVSGRSGEPSRQSLLRQEPIPAQFTNYATGSVHFRPLQSALSTLDGSVNINLEEGAVHRFALLLLRKRSSFFINQKIATWHQILSSHVYVAPPAAEAHRVK